MQLKKLGVKVEVFDVPAMKKLGMNALLGVGQGSTHDARMVVMQWNGAKKSAKKDGPGPLAFIGKGVCFDSGGLSLKTGAGMMGMKGDMAGAAAVVGLMHALAKRKARVDAVGLIGLVENMPDGNAQRPNDIVKTMSGQTIEILNTDAEGRLVLADVLWYAQSRFKPRFMINLATLTGAILVALGTEHAGLFSNNDELSQRLTKAGLKEGELVWRLPLGDAYDKLVKSKIADMKNIGGPNAGSITAAQILQRFVNKVPWVHLDIAGVAWQDAEQKPLAPSWGTGWGVRLLNRLTADFYE
jgi:leucyl aminopeptidase